MIHIHTQTHSCIPPIIDVIHHVSQLYYNICTFMLNTILRWSYCIPFFFFVLSLSLSHFGCTIQKYFHVAMQHRKRSTETLCSFPLTLRRMNTTIECSPSQAVWSGCASYLWCDSENMYVCWYTDTFYFSFIRHSPNVHMFFADIFLSFKSIAVECSFLLTSAT